MRHKLLWDFDIQTDHLISARWPDLIISTKKKKKKKKKRSCKIVNFAVPADQKVKLKESEKKNKYVDLARELKKLWNMKVTIIPMVIGAFSTVTTGLIKGMEDLEIKGQVETIKLLHYWDRPEYWEESCIHEETCCHSNSSERPSANADVKNSERAIIILWDFEIQTEPLIPVRRSDSVLINKKKKILSWILLWTAKSK